MNKTTAWVFAVLIAFAVAFILTFILPEKYNPYAAIAVGIIVGAFVRPVLGKKTK